MALQGTLDTFALPDVLRLLAATCKTGQLRVDATTGQGSVWVDGGGIVGLDATRGGDAPVERLFELLRATEGSFTFDADSPHPAPEAPVEVEPLLAEAEALLSEWRLIEAVVPSLSSWVSLSPDLPAGEVTLDRARWQTIIAIAGGCTVADLGAALGLAEVPVSRVVKQLVELGLVEVGTAHAPVITLPDAATIAPEPAPAAPTLTVAEPVAAPAPSFTTFDSASLPPAPWDDELSSGPDEASTLLGSALPADTPDELAAAFPSLAASVAADADLDADDVARQLANLSPRAAQAVRAAAAASTDAEREAALAEVPDGDDEPLNRGLLLKFLSSVRS